MAKVEGHAAELLEAKRMLTEQVAVLTGELADEQAGTARLHATACELLVSQDEVSSLGGALMLGDV